MFKVVVEYSHCVMDLIGLNIRFIGFDRITVRAHPIMAPYEKEIKDILAHIKWSNNETLYKFSFIYIENIGVGVEVKGIDLWYTGINTVKPLNWFKGKDIHRASMELLEDEKIKQAVSAY